MAYHTLGYLFLFLPIVLVIYQIMPKKIRWSVLLIAGYVYFWSFSRWLVVYLLGATIVSYSVGIILAKQKNKCRIETEGKSKEEKKEIKAKYKKKEKTILICGVLLLLGILAYLKYYNFFASNMNSIFIALGGDSWFKNRKILQPIGISFYTLEAVSYMADVYWEKIPPCRNFFKVALFLNFFPQIMEGPICTFSQTADSLWEGKSLKEENLSSGWIRIFWGLFKKMVIADRLYVIVQAIFEEYEKYNGVMIAVAAVAYTIQLYMEFSGCMDIVIGSGKLFGVSLPENFRQPFLSKNASEFWRRWHISLGAWFKAYVFYPVSVSGIVKKWNKFSKKHLSKHMGKIGVSAIALLPVWLGNGLWHGSRWSYIFYGVYYFVILLFEVAIEPLVTRLTEKLKINVNSVWWNGIRIFKTWIIIFTGELFFRANGLMAGFRMFTSMFHNFGLSRLWNGTLLGLGLDKADFIAIIIGCIVVAIVGIVKERKLLGDEGLKRLKTPLRWAIYYALILSVIILGAYGIGYQQVDLIYAGF